MRAAIFVLALLWASTSFAQCGFDLPLAPPPSPIGSSSLTTQPVAPDIDEDEPRDTPPPVIYGEEIDSENDTIVYVIDRSGSMGGGRGGYISASGNSAYGNRMDRAKAELKRSIAGLSENFKFNVVAFDCGIGQWSAEMRQANDENKRSASFWVGLLDPGGGTGTGPATAYALRNRENMAVVLLTDGGPNCGAAGPTGHRTMIRLANSQGATINVFGIAASGSYRAFCQGVAADSGGTYFDIP